jgi:pseudomonalisin
MTRRSTVLLLFLLVLAALPAALPAAACARVLHQNVLSRLDRAQDLGAAPAAQRLTIGVSLQRPDAAGEQRLVRDLFDPSSAGFHRFLTPQAFAQRFGVPAPTVQATRAWLAGGNLRVDYAAAAGDYLLASGAAGDVAALLHTSFHRFGFAGQTFVANLAAPTVPDGLPVSDVLGLNTFQRFHTMHSEASVARGASATPDPGSRTPEELWSIYEQPAQHTGQGVSVAILGNGATDSVIADLHQFDDAHRLPRVPVDVVRTPAGGDFSDTSGNPEWNIDMQAIHGMAPGIDREVLYFSPTLADTELVASTTAWVNDPKGPPIMNASLGECEVTPLNDALNSDALLPLNGNENTTGSALPVTQGLSNSSEPAQTKALQQAVIEGRTFFASSGDAGSSCGVLYLGPLGAANGVANFGVPLTEDPGNNPYATGVGGTVLYSDGAQPAGRALEYAWTHSGGNASPFQTAPDYQQGVANLDRPCVMDQTGQPTNTGQLCRAVPDVGAISGDVLSNGYTIISGGKDSSGGGTSLSSPLWAGMWARIAGTAPAGTSYGFANQVIYKIAKDPQRYAESFFDVTAGSNGLNPALPGYDYVTGFGAPRLAGLLRNVQALAPPGAVAAGVGGGAAGASAPGAGASGSSSAKKNASSRRRRASHNRRTGRRHARRGHRHARHRHRRAAPRRHR